MNKLPLVLAALAALSFAACSTLEPLSSRPPYKSLTVPRPFSTGSGVWNMKISMPAGTYSPQFEDKYGYYYAAPQKIVAKDFMLSSMLEGGLFLRRGGVAPSEMYFLPNALGLPTRQPMPSSAEVNANH